MKLGVQVGPGPGHIVLDGDPAPILRPRSVMAKWLDGSRCDVSIRAFADDTQLYLRCFRDEMAATVVRLERCLEEVSHWMSANRLILWAGSKYSQPSLGSKGLPLQIDSDTVTASDHVRVLGVTFSADLSLEKHLSLIHI